MGGLCNRGRGLHGGGGGDGLGNLKASQLLDSVPRSGQNRILTRPHQDQAFARHNKTIPRPLRIIFLKHYPILSQQAIPTTPEENTY